MAAGHPNNRNIERNLKHAGKPVRLIQRALKLPCAACGRIKYGARMILPASLTEIPQRLHVVTADVAEANCLGMTVKMKFMVSFDIATKLVVAHISKAYPMYQTKTESAGHLISWLASSWLATTPKFACFIGDSGNSSGSYHYRMGIVHRSGKVHEFTELGSEHFPAEDCHRRAKAAERLMTICDSADLQTLRKYKCLEFAFIRRKRRPLDTKTWSKSVMRSGWIGPCRIVMEEQTSRFDRAPTADGSPEDRTHIQWPSRVRRSLGAQSTPCVLRKKTRESLLKLEHQFQSSWTRAS